MSPGTEESKRVMVGIGSRALASFIQKTLQTQGYEVILAEDGDELLMRLSEANPDLLILQNQFHTKDGFKLYESIRKISGFQDTPVLMIMNGDWTTRCQEAGIRYRIQIPFEADQLVSLVTTIFSRGRTILLVDDSRIIHKDLGEFLRSHGYYVLEAYDGEEGLERIRQFQPDLIITDIEMPKMTGYELCQKVKMDPALEYIPVIICSSLADGIDIEKGFEVGANDYLAKPTNKHELLDVVKRFIEAIQLKGREKILVADDSDMTRNMIKIGLWQQGFIVETAKDGREAYEKCLRFQPDILITDFMMPGIDGLELSTRLREKEETKSISIIMMTARANKAELARTIKMGLDAFITKPFQNDRLIVIVERLLAERRLRREKEAMKHYLSEAAVHQAELLAAQKASSTELRADEKKLTILFSDIVGFTPTCERLTPREIVTLMNDYFDVMAKILKEHDAIIDKFIRDAIMALFEDKEGTPGALQAVRSGLRMQEALKVFNKNRQPPLSLRIGINTGIVVQGDIGSRFLRRDYTVIGDNVNLAQRLESAAPPGGILISRSTYEEVQDHIGVQEIPPLSLKGKSETTPAYLVKAAH